MARILMIGGDGSSCGHVDYGYYRMKEEGYEIVLAAPEKQELAETELLAEPRQRCGRHNRRFEFGLLPFVVMRELTEQHVGDHESEH